MSKTKRTEQAKSRSKARREEDGTFRLRYRSRAKQPRYVMLGVHGLPLLTSYPEKAEQWPTRLLAARAVESLPLALACQCIVEKVP